MTRVSQTNFAGNTSTPICLPNTTFVVGFVRGQFFRKRIKGSTGIILKPRPALAVDVGTLDAAEAAGAVFVVITDSETNTTYAQRIATIRAHGWAVDRGFGRQLALDLDAYAINGAAPARPPGAPVTNAERKAAQPAQGALFDLADVDAERKAQVYA